ncbi:MAG TPA: ComF family protein [Candidatus Aquicultor sp.]|jgi:ComF family protein
MRDVINSLLDLIFPSSCRLCGAQSSQPICRSCLQAFPRIGEVTCSRCGKPTEKPVQQCQECNNKDFHFAQARAGGIYTGLLKDAIHNLKYRNGKRLVSQLAEFTARSTGHFLSDADAIAFVPLTRRKEAVRGYNQSKLLAVRLAASFDKPLYSGLVKTKDITEQNKLGLTDRAGNVAGAFSARIPVTGRVVLIDDVFTTGSTASECAAALRAAGAAEVCVVTVARTPLMD